MLRNVLAVICVSLISHSAAAQTSWGLLANPGFDQQPVKATYFFAGNWNNGSQWYEYPVAPNYQDYTVYPQKPQHLGWSESQTNRDFALNTIAGMGFNVVLMSYWGARGTSYWATYAPMQTSTYAHD